MNGDLPRPKERKRLVKKTISLLLALLLILPLPGCGAGEAPTSAEPDSADQSLTSNTEGTADIEVRSSGKQAEAGENRIELSGESVTIDEGGVYRITGVLKNGQLLIDAGSSADLTLILDGAEIRCEGHAAIYGKSADSITITAESGSSNLLAAAGSFIQSDDNNVDAAVFSKCDLTLNGEGLIGVLCDSGHGVVSKDKLMLQSGSWNIQASGQGFSGKDGVSVSGGAIHIVSGTDGVHAAHDNAKKGNVELSGGSITIECGSDGVDASGALAVSGGSLDIRSGSADADGGKGLKASGPISITGGTVTVSSWDDAIHSDDSVTISGGELELDSRDDAVHADDLLTVNDGTLTITRSYEGLEAREVVINGGVIRLNASDDGVNAGGGNDGSNAFGPRGGDPFAADSNASLAINGGTLYINASGDGVDSNGSLTVTGGELYISGPTNNGNGALDYGTSAQITGGVVAAAGSAGMAENFGPGSTQGSILLNLGNQKAGEAIRLTDSQGRVLLEFTPEKDYQSVVISTPELALGESYTLTAGNFSQSITLTELIYGNGMGMGGPGCGPGGMGGGPAGPGDMDGGPVIPGGPGGPGGMGGGPGGRR